MKTKLDHHHAVEDPDLLDTRTGTRFCRCRLRMDHPRHDMPETTAEQRAHDAALLGERPEDQ